MLKQGQDQGDSKKYVFKSLLRQEYFNQRFKYKDLKLSSKVRREVQNFVLVSDLLADPEQVTYCEEITSKKSAYLLKYFPYKCVLCKKHSSHILIA